MDGQSEASAHDGLTDLPMWLIQYTDRSRSVIVLQGSTEASVRQSAQNGESFNTLWTYSRAAAGLWLYGHDGYTDAFCSQRTASDALRTHFCLCKHTSMSEPSSIRYIVAVVIEHVINLNGSALISSMALFFSLFFCSGRLGNIT